MVLFHFSCRNEIPCSDLSEDFVTDMADVGWNLNDFVELRFTKDFSFNVNRLTISFAYMVVVHFTDICGKAYFREGAKTKTVDNFSLCGIFHWALFNWFGISRDVCVWHVLLWIVDGCWVGRVHSRSPCIGGLFCCVKLYNFWPGDHGARSANTTVTPSAIRLKMKNLLLWAATKGYSF